MMSIGVLAVQGAFIEHESAFRSVGADVFEIRQLKDLDKPMHALVLPGGESTVQGKLLHDLGLFNPLRERIANGLPVFATCAGLILLAEKLKDDSTVWFGTLPVTVGRNAYGRQLGSFATIGTVDGCEDMTMTFIRAPSIASIGQDVEVISLFNGMPTGVRYKNMTALAWHPELNPDRRMFERFLSGISS